MVSSLLHTSPQPRASKVSEELDRKGIRDVGMLRSLNDTIYYSVFLSRDGHTTGHKHTTTDAQDMLRDCFTPFFVTRATMVSPQ